MKTKDNSRVQFLRGIAIIAVVMIHTIRGDIAIIIRPFLNFSVALFIFLSGYLTNFSLKDSIRKFYKKRLIRIGIPYLIWSIIYTVAYSDYNSFIKNIVTGQACGIYYYILVYLQLTLLMPLSFKLVNSKYKILGFLVTPIIIIGYYLYIYYTGKEIWYPWNANNFAVWYIYFYLGIFLREKKIAVYENKQIMLVILGVLFQFFEAYVWNKIGFFSMATTQIKISVLFTNINFLLFLEKWLSKKDNSLNLIQRKIVKIGDVSFGVYLSHMLIIGVLNKLIFRFKEIIFPLNSILVLVVTCICILIGRKILKKYSKYLGLD